MAAGRDESQIAHFLTLEALQEYHYRIFQPGAQLHYIGKTSPWCVISLLPHVLLSHRETTGQLRVWHGHGHSEGEGRRHGQL